MNIAIIRRESQAHPFTFSPHPSIHPFPLLARGGQRRSRDAHGLTRSALDQPRAAPPPAAVPVAAPVDVVRVNSTTARRSASPSAIPWAGRSTVTSRHAIPHQAPARRPSPPGRPPPRRHPPRLRPGRDPVRRPRPALMHRSTWCAAAHVAAQRLSGCPSAPIGLHQVRRSPCRRPRPAVSPPSPRLRPAPTGSGTPGTPPGHPRSVPARPLRARTLCRAYACPVSGKLNVPGPRRKGASTHPGDSGRFAENQMRNRKAASMRSRRSSPTSDRRNNTR